VTTRYAQISTLRTNHQNDATQQGIQCTRPSAGFQIYFPIWAGGGSGLFQTPAESAGDGLLHGTGSGQVHRRAIW
jgi:hypothetical protein